MAISAIASHTKASNNGDPSDFAIAAGVRKMPRAMESPVTTAIAAAKPSCLVSFCLRVSNFDHPTFPYRTLHPPKG
jgi:hypothetical protein